MDLTGQTLLGKYEIESLLGQGGMGAVWRARHTGTGRKLAIKVLDESYLGNSQVTHRFGREARAASAIQHPGIVEVLDIDEMQDGLPFIVMEFLEGETLARRIERRGRLDEPELVRLGVMLLEALEAAHAHGVIHRDLKPENIYVVPAGRRGEVVKILDFGISHMREEDAHKLTMTGSVLGTPHYMSPEQAMGETEVDHRADLYAAGVVLYECAVGDVPYDAPNYNKLLRLILDQDPPSPRSREAEISEAVERVILWAMDKVADRRVPSARTMIDSLLGAAKGEMPPYVPAKAVSVPSGPAPVPLKATPLESPRPAGALPAARGSSLLLGEARVDVDIDVPDEEPGGWVVSPTLASAAQAKSSAPPPSGDVELSLDPPANRRPRASIDELEIDEDALRSSVPQRRSVPAPVGASPSTGPYAALSSNPPPLGRREADLGGANSGSPHVPRRLSELSGGYEQIPEAPAGMPSWLRYTLFAALGIAVFVLLVYGVRVLVQPGIDPEVEHPTPRPVVDVGDHEPDELRWVSIQVDGLPPSARLVLDGLPASSPLRLRRGGQHVIEITATGYEVRRIELTADRNRTINARLRPAVQNAP